MRYWGTRWRRAIVTKNYHWRAAMQARWANWLLGRGFNINAEYSREAEAPHQTETVCDQSKRYRISTSASFKVVCVCCGKHFRRQSATATTLKPHKSPDGLPCCGTIAHSA